MLRTWPGNYNNRDETNKIKVAAKRQAMEWYKGSRKMGPKSQKYQDV
jgi:hypothetical protein